MVTAKMVSAKNDLANLVTSPQASLSATALAKLQTEASEFVQKQLGNKFRVEEIKKLNVVCEFCMAY